VPITRGEFKKNRDDPSVFYAGGAQASPHKKHVFLKIMAQLDDFWWKMNVWRYDP
jgi:Na+-transporting NADH:ubiquinone oxidoreductase subunit NqrF